ncbi:MAG TPA: LAGLIDADG family homing endonuclease [Acidimicrobiales bacterium]|nr:LAGLIDADG family homing endonuclease [Acidimicrobiales bacterium]
MAGEGCFSVTRKLPAYRDGSERLRFVFTVTMASRDRPLLVALRSALGVGSITDRPSRKKGWEPESTFSVGSHRAHRRATIPFAEAFLLPCAKREQFDQWRDRLFAYEEEHPNRWGNGPSMCSVPGCVKPVRGQGLCRTHYHHVTGY